MNRTVVDLDDAVLGCARELSGPRTKMDVITAALDEFVRRREVARYEGIVLSGELDDLADPDVIGSAQR